jgi:hypothetical protein
MAGNILTIQKLIDGNSKVVIKVDGVVDTSDIAATGTLGTAATGATTTGSTTITFTAGGLLPVQGQYVTGTGIPAGAYIVSFTTTSAVLNVAATATNSGLTFTLVAGNIVLLDPALLSPVDQNGTIATKLRIDQIIPFDIEDLLSVNLFWDATTPVAIWHLDGRGDIKDGAKIYGGLQNNAGAGVTGRILAATQGWTTGAILSFSFVMECTKQWAPPM